MINKKAGSFVMNRVRELVGASEIYCMGYDGTGIGVAVLDSGEPVIIMSG